MIVFRLISILGLKLTYVTLDRAAVYAPTCIFDCADLVIRHTIDATHEIRRVGRCGFKPRVGSAGAFGDESANSYAAARREIHDAPRAVEHEFLPEVHYILGAANAVPLKKDAGLNAFKESCRIIMLFYPSQRRQTIVILE